MAWSWRAVAGLALAVLASPCAWGQSTSCEPANRLTFAEGKTGCLTDYTLHDITPTGFSRPLKDLLRPQGTYAIAANTNRRGACPQTMALAQEIFGGSGDPARARLREGNAQSSCNSAVLRVSMSPECSCEPVVSDGRALLPKEEFDRRYLREELLARAEPERQLAAEAARETAQAEALSCPDSQRLQFADGGRPTCLGGYAFAAQSAWSHSQPMKEMLPAARRYVVAASTSASCPAAFTVKVDGGLFGGPRIEQMASEAIAECRLILGMEGTPPDCECAVILNQGRSPFGRDAFARIVAPRAIVAAAPAAAEPEPPPVVAETAQPVVAAPTAVAAAPPAAAAPVASPATAAPPTASPVAAAQPAAASPAPLVMPAPVSSARRHALVIGNNAYRHVAGLSTARSDARAMASALGAAGFDVTLQMDVDERGFKQTLRDFRLKIDPGDEVVLFFAGHGVQFGGANFLLPIDIRGDSEEQVRDDAMPLQRILDDLADRRAGFTLAILDACRDNPFRTSSTRALGVRGLAPTTAATGQMIIYSAGTGQQALDRLGPDDRDPNGLFTRVFLREMDKPDLTVDRMLRNVRNEVVRLARSVGHQQTPALYDQAVGDFYLKRR
jgi:hypothetical protein